MQNEFYVAFILQKIKKNVFLLSGFFWHFGKIFVGIVQVAKFCLVGGTLFGARLTHLV